MKKLTLGADEEVIRQAKRLAAENHTSVSAMFSRWVRTMARQKKEGPREKLGPLTRKALGLVKLPEDKSDRELLEEALAEQYEIEL